MEFERFEVTSHHSINSRNVMVEKETGRVVAVFYNDYDMNDVLEQLGDVDKNTHIDRLDVQIRYLKQEVKNLEYQLWESLT